MSTTFVSLTLEALKEDLMENILNEPFDMLDEFPKEEIADCFKYIALVEKAHEQRYRKLLDNIKYEKVFTKDGVVKWKCRNCGYVYESKEAAEKCPACNHPRSYQELFVENY